MDMLEQSGGAVAIEVPPSPTATGGTHDQSFAVGSEEVSTEALRRKHEEMFGGSLFPPFWGIRLYPAPRSYSRGSLGVLEDR